MRVLIRRTNSEVQVLAPSIHSPLPTPHARLERYQCDVTVWVAFPFAFIIILIVTSPVLPIAESDTT